MPLAQLQGGRCNCLLLSGTWAEIAFFSQPCLIRVNALQFMASCCFPLSPSNFNLSRARAGPGPGLAQTQGPDPGPRARRAGGPCQARHACLARHSCQAQGFGPWVWALGPGFGPWALGPGFGPWALGPLGLYPGPTSRDLWAQRAQAHATWSGTSTYPRGK